jgi:hypothetical protein
MKRVQASIPEGFKTSDKYPSSKPQSRLGEEPDTPKAETVHQSPRRKITFAFSVFPPTLDHTKDSGKSQKPQPKPIPKDQLPSYADLNSILQFNFQPGMVDHGKITISNNLNVNRIFPINLNAPKRVSDGRSKLAELSASLVSDKMLKERLLERQ